jgi:hypothetical protein
MPVNQKQLSSRDAFAPPLGMLGPAMEYLVDAAQRSVLFWDIMRQRGNQYRQHLAEPCHMCSTTGWNWSSAARRLIGR